MTNMRPEILSLGFVNFHETCKALCKVSFSDVRKKVFCQELMRISEFFLGINATTLAPAEITAKKRDLDFFWQWALALDDRNGYTLSHEMRGTMDNLCKHWVAEHSKYIFAATDGNFSINRYYSSWDVLMDKIDKIYGMKFSHQLVTFEIPKPLFNDFFFVSIIYHEMGHFVDNYYNISDEVARRIKGRLSTPVEEEKIRKVFFPILQNIYDEPNGVYSDEKKRDEYIEAYVGEYISDLFGAQYVGPHIINHIELNRHGTYNLNHETHPSPNARSSLIMSFLKNDSTNFLLKDILDSFVATGYELKNRYVRPVDALNLEKGQPLNITNDDELHSLFQLGWDIYFKGPGAMDAVCGNVAGTTNQYEFYIRLNDAMKKSISNYLG